MNCFQYLNNMQKFLNPKERIFYTKTLSQDLCQPGIQLFFSYLEAFILFQFEKTASNNSQFGKSSQK